jgi:hypothetical protein
MQVRHALHHLGADLGDPITVGRGSRGEVIVEVLGVTPARLRQVEDLLHRYPAVVLDRSGRLLGSPKSCAGCEPTPPLLISSGGATSLDAVLVSHFGGEDELQAFSRELLGLSESAIAHAYALRILASRYDATAERLLSLDSKRQLWEMIVSHTEALTDKSSQIEVELRPLLHDVALRQDDQAAASFDVSWQQGAITVFRRVQGIDRLVKTAFTRTNSSIAPSEALSKLSMEAPATRAFLAKYRIYVERKSTPNE